MESQKLKFQPWDNPPGRERAVQSLRIQLARKSRLSLANKRKEERGRGKTGKENRAASLGSFMEGERAGKEK